MGTYLHTLMTSMACWKEEGTENTWTLTELYFLFGNMFACLNYINCLKYLFIIKYFCGGAANSKYKLFYNARLYEVLLHCKKCRWTFRRTFKEFRPDVEKIQYHWWNLLGVFPCVFFFYPANGQESSTLAQSKNFVLVSD